jgi:hypothetical protein
MNINKTKSEIFTDKFKFCLPMKKIIKNKVISNLIKIPVVIYVKNLNIPDIKKTIFLIDRFLTVEQIIHHIKYNEKLYLQDYSIIEKLCLKTEQIMFQEYYYKDKNIDENDNYIVNDILIEELYEYEVNKDGFLYLVLDIKKS